MRNIDLVKKIIKICKQLGLPIKNKLKLNL